MSLAKSHGEVAGFSAKSRYGQIFLDGGSGIEERVCHGMSVNLSFLGWVNTLVLKSKRAKSLTPGP